MGEDFVALDQVLVFSPDDVEMSVSLTILNDDIVEEDETMQLLLAAGEGERAVQLAQGGVVNGVIEDDDDSKKSLIVKVEKSK